MKKSDAPGFQLNALLRPEMIELALRGNQRDEVLVELINLIPELRNRPDLRATLLKALQEREQLHSTGIGDGIALPHARNALVGLVSQPVIVFGRHPHGVQYGSIDHQPARLFFLLVTTNVSQHLQILSRLGRLLRDSRLRQGLLLADRAEKVIELIKESEADFLS